MRACGLPSPPIESHKQIGRVCRHAERALVDRQTNLGKSFGIDRYRTGCARQLADDVDQPIGYKPIACVDASQLSSQMPGWNFEFAQLSPGALHASGGMVALNCALVGQLTLDQTMLRRGHAPHGSVGVLIPGSASSQAFVGGRRLQPAQCVAMADGASIDMITHRDYIDVALAVDLHALREQPQWLGACALATRSGSWVAAPGSLWINRMRRTVRWLLTAIRQYPQAMGRPDIRASLADQFVMAMADFGSERADAERPPRDVRVQQRIAVERAREYIRGKLAEPLPLSELCRYAHVQARSLEYGFREITGLSPIAYVKSLRLNAVRRDLSRTDAADHSISEIALDHGFWHLSQFAADYRKFFGETPTSTRHRARALHAPV
jgi:AraC family transcriptional regulator, ethanolamine operon transcriptional activator